MVINRAVQKDRRLVEIAYLWSTAPSNIQSLLLIKMEMCWQGLAVATRDRFDMVDGERNSFKLYIRYANRIYRRFDKPYQMTVDLNNRQTLE